jgi:hypothetical protein
VTRAYDQVKGDDVQPLPPDTKAAGKAKEADVVEKKDDQNPPEMSFVEKLALKVAKLTGSVPTDAVFEEKVCWPLHLLFDF